MSRADHFEIHADVYGWARPEYPDALWERLAELGVLRPGLRAVELGAGTGQATRRLATAGLQVTAIEPGPRLAAELARRCPGVDVRATTAEQADLGEGRFDLAVIATAAHWLDLDVVLPKLHRALVPGGRLLVWRNEFGDAEAELTPFRERMGTIVAARRRPPRADNGVLDTAAWRAVLTASGLFDVDRVETFRWSIELDERQLRGLFTTFSDWSADEVDAVGRAVRELGGRVVEHYATPLIVLIRAGTDR